MPDLLGPVFGWFVSMPGLLLLAALDSSFFFYLPFALDGVLVYLVATHPDLFWAYALLTTVGACAGAVPTWWVGDRVGEPGLERLLSKKRARKMRRRAHERAETTLALPALVPPPFPYTPYILAAGALRVDARRFFGLMLAARLARFGTEAVLARIYGESLLRWMRSDTFRYLVWLGIAAALVGTGWAIWRAIRDG